MTNNTKQSITKEDVFMNNNLLVLTREEEAIARSLELTELREKLQNQLEEAISDFAFLEEEKATIGNPEKLGEVIKTVVWEEVINQIASKAGEDFIKENNGLNLDLSKGAHFQTSENFENGIIATHNTEIDYQERYDNWQSNFQRNEDGSIRMKKDPRTGEMKEVIRVRDRKKDPKGENYNTNYNAREPFDKNRPKGSTQENIDEVIPVAELLRDPVANAHMTKEELVAFDNSDKNLNPMDSAANQSKGDSTMSEFLDSERDGKKPAERFNIDEEALRKKDAEAREEYEKLKKEAEQRSIEAGKKSRRNEAKRIGGKTLRAVVMQFLAELIKEVISKLVKWLKSAGKKLETLLASLKEAIVSFVGKLKVHLMNAADCAVTTIATALFGPVVNTIKKIFILFKQGYRSLKEAVMYIKRPENRGKPIGILTLEVGKIVTAGFTAIGGIVLGEVIEKGLMAIPGAGVVFAFEIPLLGSLANILGIFLGALVAGIIGAIAVNMIDKAIAKKKKAELTSEMVGKNNEILSTQNEIFEVEREQMIIAGKNMVSGMARRHSEGSDIIRRSASELFNADSNYDNKENFRKICELSAECNSRLTVIKNF